MDSASDADVKPGGPGEDPPPAQPLGLSAPSNGGLRVLLPVALGLLALDLITKIWAVSALDDGRRIDLVWTLRLNLVRNEGAAFSLGTSITPIIAVASLGVAIAVVYVGRRIERPAVLAALGLVLGGAVGNVVDRIFREGDGFLRGAVVDFIDFQWWPVFNVADMGIVIGGLLLVFLLSEPSEPTEPGESAEPTDPCP